MPKQDAMPSEAEQSSGKRGRPKKVPAVEAPKEPANLEDFIAAHEAAKLPAVLVKVTGPWEARHWEGKFSGIAVEGGELAAYFSDGSRE